jgi:hypothetical protein
MTQDREDGAQPEKLPEVPEISGAETIESPGMTPDEEPPVVPIELAEVDPAKLAALREKLKKYATTNKKTISGSEATDTATPADGTGEVMQGKDVDWSEYDLEFSVRHLYPQAQYRLTPQGPRWVAMADEFTSCERSFGNQDQRLKDGSYLNVAQYLNDMLNGPEGWRLVSMLPAGSGRVGVMLQHSVPIVLPEPRPLKKATEVAPPTDPELQREEDAALAFAENEGLTPVAPDHV